MLKKHIQLIRVKIYNGSVNFLNIQTKQPIKVSYVWKLEQLNQELNGISDDSTVFLHAWYVIVRYDPELSTLEIVEGPYEDWINRGNLSILTAIDLLKDYDKEPVFNKPIRQNRTLINFD